MAKVINADGTTSEITGLNLKTIQGIVGGYFEQYKLTHGRLILMNEDGLRLKLPHNAEGSRLLSKEARYLPGDHIVVGNVIVCDESELE